MSRHVPRHRPGRRRPRHRSRRRLTAAGVVLLATGIGIVWSLVLGYGFASQHRDAALRRRPTAAVVEPGGPGPSIGATEASAGVRRIAQPATSTSPPATAQTPPAVKPFAPGRCPSGGIAWEVTRFEADARQDASSHGWDVHIHGAITNDGEDAVQLGAVFTSVAFTPLPGATVSSPISVPTPAARVILSPGSNSAFDGLYYVQSMTKPSLAGVSVQRAWQDASLRPACSPP